MFGQILRGGKRMLRVISLLAALMITFILIQTRAAMADDYTVPCDTTALVAGLAAANSSAVADTLNLTAGCTYTLTSTITVASSGGALTINGNGATLAGNDTFRIITVPAGATLHLNNTVIQDGFDAGEGGGINNEGTLNITGSRFTGNSSTGTGPFQGGFGGAINNEGGLYISGSTFTNNSAVMGGGLSNRGTAQVLNSVFTGNTSTSGGGGIVNSSVGTLTLTNSTISGSVASSQGGLYNDKGSITLTNNTFVTGGAYSLNNPAINSNVSTFRNNIFPQPFASSCGVGFTVDGPNLGCGGSVTGDARLGAFNGTVFPLLPGSPAIDAGNNATCPAADQVGGSRFDGNGDGIVTCDLGASEAQFVSPTLSISDVTQSEGNSGATTFSFMVSLNILALTDGVTFNIATANGTATTSDSDYVANALTAQTIPAGSSGPYTFNVTVNGDLVAEANESFFVNLTSVSGAFVSDGQGTGTITNDDTAGITINPTSGLTTTEAGGTATFNVSLSSQPTADVTIDLTSSDTTEGTVTTSVTLNASNWQAGVSVTVTGVDDLVDDGNITYSIVTAAASSSNSSYNGLNSADVSVTNTDNDVAGITVSPTTLTTTEAGGTAAFTMVLNSEPLNNVEFTLSTSDTTEGSIDTSLLTFTPANWNIAQTVTVTGVDDLVDDGNIAYTILTGAASSSDASYNGLSPADVSVTNTDNDAAGITIGPTTLTTTEAGGTATFTVVLNTEPQANVDLGLSSSDTTEGTTDISLLTFTPANWNIAQTVTVTGEDDTVDDGDIAYTIVTNSASSGDLSYNNLDPADVSVTNTDDDGFGISINPTSGLITTEAGGTATFVVVLNSQPTANVIMGLSGSNLAEGTINVTALTFTDGNWNIPQTVTITGVDDAVDDGDVAYSIMTDSALSSDLLYNGYNPDDVSVTNIDDDTLGITVTPTNGLTTTEAGGTASFEVVLNSEPTADVTIAVSSSDTSEGSVDPASLIFTSTNWDKPQTVTVTGVDDMVADGDTAYTVVLSAASGGDYAGIDVDDVGVTNIDNENADVLISPTAFTATENQTHTYTIQLSTLPSGTVTIAAAFDPAQLEVNGSSAPVLLTFTDATPQNVTVRVLQNDNDDANRSPVITHTISTSSAPEYPSGMVLESVTFNIEDLPPPPPVPTCEDHNFDEGGVVRSSTVDGVDIAINCRVMYQNGSPTTWYGADLYGAGNIGIQGVIDLGVQQAIDIFSPSGMTYFEGGAVFCLRGSGTLIWMAASHTPRIAEIIGSYTVSEFSGFTCATLFEPGTLVLVSRNPVG